MKDLGYSKSDIKSIVGFVKDRQQIVGDLVIDNKIKSVISGEVILKRGESDGNNFYVAIESIEKPESDTERSKRLIDTERLKRLIKIEEFMKKK